MVARGQLSMGDVVAFLMYAAMLASQVQGLARTSTTFDTTLVAVERVLGVIDLSPELQTKADGTRQILTEPIREVRLERVGYRLPKAESETVAGLEAPPVSGDQGEAAEGGEWVLKDVDLVLTAGNPVALVGQSGAGKSTIARLLTGAIRPTEGRILVNGIDLCSLDLVSYRRQLSVVSHEDFLLGRDLLSNIYYRLESQTEGGSRLEKIKSALRMDQLFRRESLRAAMSGLRSCLKVGVAIPEELTRIRRWKVSAGERQRIALMRELLYNARFLILDEACSNLDGEVEKNLIDLLREKHAGLLLVISHRSSMVQEYSKIVLLQGGLGGSILERGSHNELIRRDAAYRRLFDPRGRAVSREGSSIAKELE
jgi:ABC-type multidrug transport system fused ATPase/permease subunit